MKRLSVTEFRPFPENCSLDQDKSKKNQKQLYNFHRRWILHKMMYFLLELKKKRFSTVFDPRNFEKTKVKVSIN